MFWELKIPTEFETRAGINERAMHTAYFFQNSMIYYKNDNIAHVLIMISNVDFLSQL